MKDLFIPLLTVLASGITAAVVTHILNARREERLLVRQKLEDLHLALHTYTTAMGSSFMSYLRAMEGKIDYNQANDLSSNGVKDVDRNAFPTVQRLIGIYFPDLQSQMDEILKCRSKLNELKHQYKQDYQRGTTAHGPWTEPFRAELVRMEHLSEELKKRIARHPIKTTGGMPIKTWMRFQKAAASLWPFGTRQV